MPLAVALPSVLADDLVAAGVCNRPLSRRTGAGMPAVAVTIVGVAGNLSSVIVALPMLQQFAQRLVGNIESRRSCAQATIDLRMTRPDGTVVELSVAAASAQTATEAVIDTLRAAQDPPVPPACIGRGSEPPCDSTP